MLGKLPLKNRILKAATYEGKTPDGVPGDLLLDFHRSVVEGGTAMTTIGYCTTEADGRINDQMMWLHDGVRPQLRGMIEELKLISPQVCERHKIIPVSRAGSSLIVAMADPSNLNAIDDVKFLTGYNVEPVVASETAISSSSASITGASSATVG